MMKNTSKMAKDSSRARHIPERTCVACRAKDNKRDFIRIVRTSSGVEVDISGKKSGRGAYLCPYYECWSLGLKGNRLEHALHTTLSDSERLALAKYAKELPRKSKI